MKTLHLLRHAKSSWKDSSLADIDRPLNKRGTNACAIMAARLVEAGCRFQHVYCSPARRARDTIANIDSSLNSLAINWHIDDDLYTFDYRDLLVWVKSLDDAVDEVVIIGHNPAITDLNNQICDSYLYNIPTCGYVQLRSDILSWQELDRSSAEMVCFLKPKMFR